MKKFLFKRNGLFAYSRHSFASNSKGFTLIEILVVLTITSVLAGIGFASFAAYSRSQQISQAAGNIRLLFNQARFNAISVVNSNRNIEEEIYTCPGSLEGYSVVMGSGLESNAVFLTQDCVGEEPVRIKSVVLPKGFEFIEDQAMCTTVHFQSLSSTVAGVPCEIEIEGFANSKTIAIDIAGNPSVK